MVAPMRKATIPRECHRYYTQSIFLIPRVSTSGSNGDKCPLDSNYIVADLCKFVNQQTLKLQECPEDVPTGEMPRHIVCMMERYLVDRIPPGTRCSVIGFVDTFDQAKQVGSKNEVVSRLLFYSYHCAVNHVL